ncbi:hypothetical protein LIA77_01583 [Sarocladium implicatum]|nr:hypothetical protein LIA77_01583 [Sarocladium implicatum]
MYYYHLLESVRRQCGFQRHQHPHSSNAPPSQPRATITSLTHWSVCTPYTFKWRCLERHREPIGSGHLFPLGCAYCVTPAEVRREGTWYSMTDARWWRKRGGPSDRAHPRSCDFSA